LNNQELNYTKSWATRNYLELCLTNYLYKRNIIKIVKERALIYNIITVGIVHNPCDLQESGCLVNRKFMNVFIWTNIERFHDIKMS
jgi:hypothetical protein